MVFYADAMDTPMYCGPMKIAIYFREKLILFLFCLYNEE